MWVTGEDSRRLQPRPQRPHRLAAGYTDELVSVTGHRTGACIALSPAVVVTAKLSVSGRGVIAERPIQGRAPGLRRRPGAGRCQSTASAAPPKQLYNLGAHPVLIATGPVAPPCERRVAAPKLIAQQRPQLRVGGAEDVRSTT